MTSAIAVLAGLVGFNVAVKVYSLMKMWGIKIDDMSEEEIIDTYNKLSPRDSFKVTVKRPDVSGIDVATPSNQQIRRMVYLYNYGIIWSHRILF